jgi:hypothetical protein
MPQHATSPSTTRFATDGYMVLEQFLDGSEIEPVRAAVEATLSFPLPPGCERPHNTLAPLSWSENLVEAVLGSRERVRRVAEACDASDLRWISAYISVKEARSGALWWHQDWWCWDHPVTYGARAPQVALLCYLDETTPSNGALRVLPGSHRRSVELHALLPEAHGDGTRELPEQHPAMSAKSGDVTLALGPGDAALLDYRLLHGTHANSSEWRRDALLFTFAPDWASLPDDLRGHLIQHPSLPDSASLLAGSPSWTEILPEFDGPRRDLQINRAAPARFAIAAEA